jgi:hypothetical protein
VTATKRRYARPDNLTETLAHLVPNPPQCQECFRLEVARWLLQWGKPLSISCPHRGGQT